MGDEARGVLGPRAGDDAAGLGAFWTGSGGISAGFSSCSGSSSRADFSLRDRLALRAGFSLCAGSSSCTGFSSCADFSSCSATEERVGFSGAC
jgi:hypothetical protein